MNRKKYLLLVVFAIVAILVSISTTFGPSKSVSSYRSEINGESNARVAKWKVTGVTKKNGQSLSLDAGFKANILEGEGNWFFDIENRSEVAAAIKKENSSIVFRLASEKLSEHETKDGDKGSIGWNFLDTENPINFKIYAYNTSAENLLFYQNINDSTITKTFAEYNQVPDSEKLNYKEIIVDQPEYKKTLILETKSDDTDTLEPSISLPLTFIREKDSTYYELSINLSQLTNLATDLGLGDNKKNICFQIAWKVESSGDYTTPSGEVQTYDTHRLVEGTPSDAQTDTYDFNGKKYYIAVEKKEFFDYAIYTSSLGGEPRFKFENSTVPYSRLSVAQKTKIESYKSYNKENITSLEELEQLIEYLEYAQYQKFIINNKKFEEFSNSLPYLQMGLQFTVQFNLLVEQID